MDAQKLEFIMGKARFRAMVEGIKVDTRVPDGLSLIELQQWFYKVLCVIIPPRNQSDRTSFKRVEIWLFRLIDKKEVDTSILTKVLDYAREAAGPDSRKPAAVFMTILKTEMGYKRGL